MVAALVHAAVLNAGVESLDLVFEAQLEIAELAATVNQEGVFLVGGLFLGRGFTDERAALDAPEGLVAIPLAEGLTIEERLETGWISGVEDSGDGKEAGEQSGTECRFHSFAFFALVAIERILVNLPSFGYTNEK